MIDYQLLHPQYVRWPRWIFGIPVEFWQAHAEFIEKFIVEHELRPVDRGTLATDDPVPLGAVALFLEKGNRNWAERLPPFPPRPFPGGLRIPHLHHNGEFYRLNEAQWADFSRYVIARVQERLNQAGTIGFEPLVKISSEIESM